MDIRRVQETGGTFLVSLPKKWARANGIKKGNLIRIDERHDGGLILYSQVQDQVHLETIVGLPSPHLRRDLIGKYLLGYDVIRITSKEMIGLSDREQVKSIVSRLIGLEIMEENSYRIVIQCLLEPSSLIPDMVLRRECAIALSMYKDAITAFLGKNQQLANVVLDRDDEVDRLYFLLVRLLRSAVQNPSLGGALEITPIDCLDYRITANLVESVGDSAVEIADQVLSSQPVDLNSEQTATLKVLSRKVEEAFDTAMRGLFLRDVDLAEQATQKHEEALHLLKVFEEEATQSMKTGISTFSIVISEISKICQSAVDIADLVVGQ
ncbi:MAG: hypothetical protein JSW01_04400 [Candidatus Bathyarchaeota archaeon]|nr:MAG: hypothetical protein JSW01_04400 [Candidatus Bathyarchaeota archaeon]